MVIGILATQAEAEGQRRGRGGRRHGRRQRPRAGRQFDSFDLGPPPQPVIDLPAAAAAPLPLPAGPANRFVPTGGPAPGSALPPESLVAGHIPDRDGNYDFE